MRWVMMIAQRNIIILHNLLLRRWAGNDPPKILSIRLHHPSQALAQRSGFLGTAGQWCFRFSRKLFWLLITMFISQRRISMETQRRVSVEFYHECKVHYFSCWRNNNYSLDWSNEFARITKCLMLWIDNDLTNDWCSSAASRGERLGQDVSNLPHWLGSQNVKAEWRKEESNNSDMGGLVVWCWRRNINRSEVAT